MTHAIYTPKGLDAINAIMAVNEMAAMPSQRAASTRGGNYPVDIYPKAPGIDTESIMRTEVHGSFRKMIADLCGLFDRASLPGTLLEKADMFDAHVEKYCAQTEKLKKIFDTLYPSSQDENYPRYSCLEGLTNRLVESPDCKGELMIEASLASLRIEGINARAEAMIVELDDEFQHVERFSLKNGTSITNTKFMNTNAAEWFFYGKYATKAVFNTIRNPQPLKEKLKDTVGIFQSITNRAVAMVTGSPELQCEAVFGVFENSVQSLQNRVAISGPFDELVAADHGKIMPMLGINANDDYVAILERLKENSANIAIQSKKIQPKPIYSRCPFGHGQQ